MTRTIAALDLCPGMRLATGKHKGAEILAKRTTGEGPAMTITIELSTGCKLMLGPKCKEKVEV